MDINDTMHPDLMRRKVLIGVGVTAIATAVPGIFSTRSYQE